MVDRFILDEVKPNPTVTNVTMGIEACKKAEADFIIAIGGGSSMDTAKGIGIVVENPEFADIVSLEGVAPTKNKCLTAATGMDAMTHAIEGLITKAVGAYKDGMTDQEAAEAACNAIEELSKLMGIPQHLSELGITEADIPALAEQAITDVCTPGNPREVTKEDIIALYHKIL